MAIERTLSIIKPDAVKGNHIGEILSRFEKAGLKIVATRMQWLSRGEAEGFFGPVLPRLERVVTPWLAPERFYARPRHPSGMPVPRAELRTSNALLRRALFAEARFDPDGALRDGGQHVIGRDGRGWDIVHFQPVQPGLREEGGHGNTVRQLAQTGLHIAAKLNHLKIGAFCQKLRPAA